MLPALPEIASDLNFGDPNDSHFIISMLFFGMALGQIFFGPLSDTIGRKPAIIGGIVIFALGSLMSYYSFSMWEMMLGRFLQGLGAAGPRIVSVALVRDCFKGREMARVMSFVMTIFILVPVFAPALGQLIINISHWRSIFAMFLVLSFIILCWFGIRQSETLALNKRIHFSFRQLARDSRYIVLIPVTSGYTLTMGLLFGGFLGYLSSAQQIFQYQYQLGQLFAVYFGVLAVSIGVAALVNAHLVMRLGMRRLSFIAMSVVVLLSAPFLWLVVALNGHPPLMLLMGYLVTVFFFFGILFGNLNALAMEPLGEIAGLGSALVGSLSTLISVVLGAIIANAYDGTVTPLITGFAGLSLLCLISMYFTEKQAKRVFARA
ncbi:MAG: multidrug effflux MFS transporter [Gammaproteobacteria bacterium]|nr:multidrug effflux MFS transporter [Gammaproteobacteria bacterium]